MVKNLRYYANLWDDYIHTGGNPTIELDRMADFVDFMQAGLAELERVEKKGENPFNREKLTKEQRQVLVDFGLFYTNFRTFEEWRLCHTKLRELISSLEEEVAKLNTQHERNLERIRELEERVRELESGAAANAEREAELARFKERHSRLEEEAARVRRDLYDAQRREHDVALRTAQWKAEVDARANARDRLDDQLDRARAAREAAAANAHEELQAMAAKRTAGTLSRDETEKAIAGARDRLASREGDLESLLVERDRASKAAATTQQALGKLQIELSEMLDGVNQLERDRATALAELDDPESVDPARAESIRSRLAEFDARTQALTDKEIELRDALVPAVTEAEEQGRAERLAQARIHNVQADLEAERRLIDDLSALVAGRQDAEKRYERLLSVQRDRLTELVAVADDFAAPDDVASRLEAPQGDGASFDKDLVQTHADVERLTGELATLMARRVELEEDAFPDSVPLFAMYRAERVEAENEATLAQEQHHAAGLESAAAAAQGRALEALLEATDAVAGGDGATSPVEREATAARIELMNLEREAAVAEAALLDEQLERSREREAELRAELADLRRQLAEVGSTRASSEAARQAAEKRAASLAERIAAMLAERSKLYEQLMALAAKIAGLNAKIAQLEERIQSMLGLEEINEQLKKRNSYLESQARKYEGVLKGDVVQGGADDEVALRDAVVSGIDVNDAAQRLSREYRVPAELPKPEAVATLVRLSEVIGRLRFRLGTPEARAEILETLRDTEKTLKRTFTRYNELWDRSDHKPLLAQELRDLLESHTRLTAWKEAADALLQVIEAAQGDGT